MPDMNSLQNIRFINGEPHDIIHEIGRVLYHENLLTDTNNLSISLNEHELIVNGVRMSEEVHKRIYKQFGSVSNGDGSHVQPYKNGNLYYPGTDGGSVPLPYDNLHPGPHDAIIKERSEEIAYELLKENLVKDRTYFSYRLSRDEFSIDGLKQPAELRRRIVDEFFKPDDEFNINYTFRYPGIYGGTNNSYNQSSAEYQRQGENQKKYWAAQQRKIIDEMAREGLINDRKDLSFTLTDKTFVINGLVQSNEVFQRYH